jgi:hypothetical protein
MGLFQALVDLRNPICNEEHGQGVNSAKQKQVCEVAIDFT